MIRYRHALSLALACTLLCIAPAMANNVTKTEPQPVAKPATSPAARPAAKAAASSVTQSVSPRFFLMGSGVMQLKNNRNNREAKVSLLNKDGSFNQEGLKTVDWLFDFPAQEKNEHISLRLMFMLSYFSDRLAPGKTIQLESAYRSPEYNQKIREQGNNVASTSTHQDGLAVDFWLPGVNGKRLWQTIKSQNCCGIGHYGGKVVHMDAGRPRFWEAATSGTKSKEPDYNRHLYLAAEYDRYKAKEPIRLGFSSLSSFDFGVHPVAEIFAAETPNRSVAVMRLSHNTENDCIWVGNRTTARDLVAQLPANLPPGRYTVKLNFCERPFEQMPTEVSTGAIEIVP